ncbi:MAG TPA: hypothetical protein VK024_07450 [Actinomycetaceae bacterium]|nr:hypothetical protein [Actinomycetaceae bacterium]
MSPLAVITRIGASAPEPSPSPSNVELTIYTVTPGISGFIVFFILAVVGILLLWSMVRHLRVVDRNAEPGDTIAERRQRRNEARRRMAARKQEEKEARKG